MILTLSPSSIENAQTCPQKYEYSSIRRLSLISENTDARDRGTLFHEMLALHYNLLIEKIPSHEIAPAVQEFAREKVRNDEFPFDMTEECIKNYMDYAVFYSSDGWTPKFVEVPFTKVIYESDPHKIILEGRIDLIVETMQGQIFPVDHKTSDKNEKPQKLSNQFMAYALVTESKNFVKNDIGFQKTYGPAQRFHRNILPYERENIEEWRENIILDGLRLIEYIEKGYFPRRYSGCRYCRYTQICETTPDNRDFKISSMYKVSEPFDIYGK